MKRIYIIDDDRNIVDSLSIVLKKEGFEVGAQNDELNVVGNLQKFKPDCVVLDVMFPENEGAGFEIARTIRKEDSLASLPILMLSAVNEKGAYSGTFSNRDIDESWLPVSEFIEKPIKPKDLIEKLNRLTS